MPPSELHLATIAFIASVSSWFNPGEPAKPASSPPAILMLVLVTPGVVPSSRLLPSPAPHGHGASPNIGAAGALDVVAAVSVGAVSVGAVSLAAVVSAVVSPVVSDVVLSVDVPVPAALSAV